jgi:hypothetical protein
MSEDVVFRWNGPQDVIPFAGTYNGRNGVINFFTNAFKYFSNFNFGNLTYEAFNNNTIVISFLETTTTNPTGMNSRK